MLATEAKVKSEGNLDASIKDEKITPHLFKASVELKKILSADVYTKVESYKDSQVAAEKEMFDVCQIAEANLAMSYAVKVLNIQTQGNGLVRTQGWDQSRSENLSQNEVEKLSDHFRNVAMNLIDPYIPQSPAASSDDGTTSPSTLMTGSFALGAI
jgi:hypothetical protein